MVLPFDAVAFEPDGTLLRAGADPATAGALCEGAATQLRRLANRLPVAFATRLPAVAAGRLQERLGVPVAVCTASLESAEAHLGAAPARLLLVAADAPALAAAAARGWHTAWLGAGAPEPPPRLQATELEHLVDAVLALDPEEDLGPHPLLGSMPREFLDGVLLFNAGRWYEAHEAWEIVWKRVGPAQGDFYRGLIQMAAAALHWERGNAAGAATLYASARRQLSGYLPRHERLDVLAFLQEMEEWFEPFHAARRAQQAPPPPRAAPPTIELELG
ncbi:MAG TPA: DUF309 domain-containing protein [Planctomycetota bacterium]